MIFSVPRQFIIIVIILLFAQNAWAIKIKIATLSPEGSMWMEKMRQGADQVAKETDNRVILKFYPGGVMGKDNAVLRKIRVGQLHGGAFVGGSLSQFFPANQIYAQPMKFKTVEEVEHVKQYIDPFIGNGLYEAGFVTFGIIGGGFAYIMSQNPIETVEDLRAQKVWIPDNDKISQDSIRAFGVAPIPLDIPDVRTSLQSGLINTVATSPVGAIVLQWHTQIKYVTNIPLIHLHAVLAIEKKKFLKISETDQKIVSRVMTHFMNEIGKQNMIDDVKAIQALKKRGITFINPPKEALDEWYRVAKIASKKMISSGILPKDIVDKLDSHLNEYNSKTQ